jgi:hypothetical protein
LSTRLLQDRGLSAKQVGRLAESGWLRRLGRGVYLLPGDELNRDASLAWLRTQVPGFHVAGKTALGWRGVRHNLAFKERLVLWGDVPTTLPTWFTGYHPQACHEFVIRGHSFACHSCLAILASTVLGSASAEHRERTASPP